MGRPRAVAGRFERTIVIALVFGLAPVPAGSALPGVRIGVLAAGPLDLITDVPGVRVGQITKIAGDGPRVPGKGPVRTGVTVVVPSDDTWNRPVAAATFDLNGNGELTGAHWIDEAGFLETPIALTNTLDVPRVGDGVIDWLLARYPDIGIRDDVPLPVVAECDDQALNDIRGRHVSAADAVAALIGAKPGRFDRGSVGAGTGMRAFGFKAGIGSASRVIAVGAGSFTVGVLVNANTGRREELRIDGVAVGRALAAEYQPVYPKRASVRLTGRAADGSIIVVLATDAPLDARQLRELAKRAALGLARTGVTSHVSSGDLFLAFSTTRTYSHNQTPTSAATLISDDTTLDALFAASAESTEAAVVDALLSAQTMVGADGITFYGLPVDRVRALLQARPP